MKEEIIFTKIIKGEIPSHKVYEDESIFAFLDIQPKSKGHTLVIPKENYKDIFEAPEETLKSLILATKKISVAAKKALGADGVRIQVNNGKSAGQEVFHIHFHVIPRFDGDWKETFKYKNEEEMIEVAEKINSSIA